MLICRVVTPCALVGRQAINVSHKTYYALKKEAIFPSEKLASTYAVTAVRTSNLMQVIRVFSATV
jgi:DNA-binding XRE family transcriptional regulator